MRRASWFSAAVAVLLMGFAADGYAARDSRETLLALDREFDETTSKWGAEGMAGYFAEDGILMLSGLPMVTGRDAIKEAMAKMFKEKQLLLRWEPLGAEISGNLGYTWGMYRSKSVDAEGRTVEGWGKYLTVWKKQRDGWKIAADCGNPSPEPKKEAAAEKPE